MKNKHLGFIFLLLCFCSLMISCSEPEFPKTETFNVKGVSFVMVKVEGGTFLMGEKAEEDSAITYLNNLTPHLETVADFSIGQTEVTQALWQAVMGENPSRFSGKNGYPEDLQRPVEYFSWDQCKEFITRLNELTGKEFRLPLEAEWEYAARGGNMSHGYRFAGSNNIDDVAWYVDNWYSNYANNISEIEDFDSLAGTNRVALKAPNELGLYDMSGNVWEWCGDLWGGYPYYPYGDSWMVLRGGSYFAKPEFCTVAYLGGFRASPGDLNYMGNSIGLRLAL